MDLPIISGIHEIADDRTSGAAELAFRAGELLSRVRPEDLPEAAQAIIRAQPAMASVYNAAQAALAGELTEFINRLQRSSEVIAERAAPLIRGKSVLTHSFSSTVLRSPQDGAPAGVVCTESLPGGEGRRTASLLNAAVIPDAAVYATLASIDVVLVGADAVSPEAVVNKIGIALVALAARERKKPVWILCGSEKFVSRDWKPELGELFEATPRTWFTGVIDEL